VNSPCRVGSTVGAPSGAMLLPFLETAKGFHSPPASALLSLAWPLCRRSGANSVAGPQGGGQEPVVRESRQREGHPTLAPYAQSLCSRCARQLRGSPTVHPWTGIELAHIVWAILRTFPAQPRRDRGDPDSAHRARQSQSALIRAVGHLLPLRGRMKGICRAETCRNPLLLLGCARRAVDGAPMQRQRGGGIARRVGARDCAQFDASPGMDCRRTPGVALRSRRAGCPETAVSGWPSLWLLSLTTGSCPPPCGPATLFAPLLRHSGHARESDSLAGRRVIPRQGCRAPKERALGEQSHWTPACAGVTRVARRVKTRHGCRAPQDDCMDAGGTTPWMGEVERRLEQPSRATPGAVAEHALQGQSHSTPACAGVTRDARRVKTRHGCRAPQDDCMDAGGTTPWMGEVERRLEQPSRATPGAVAERAPKERSRWAPACAGATEILASGYLSDRSSRNRNFPGGLQ
jgi:hypothetical protein